MIVFSSAPSSSRTLGQGHDRRHALADRHVHRQTPVSRLLMIASIAIAVLPVWRSPMISSRWPRPIGIIASIAFRPVCIGSVDRLALHHARRLELGRARLGGVDLALAVQRVAQRVDDPPEQLLADGDLEQPCPVRLTVSPSTICSHSPNSTAPTLSDSRFSARAGDVVRQLEHLERHAVLQPVQARDAVGHRQHGADLGQLGPAGVESLDAALEDAGDLIWIDLHLSRMAPCRCPVGSSVSVDGVGRRFPSGGGGRHLLAQLLQSAS